MWFLDLLFQSAVSWAHDVIAGVLGRRAEEFVTEFLWRRLRRRNLSKAKVRWRSKTKGKTRPL
jgi:hypothetical protein